MRIAAAGALAHTELKTEGGKIIPKTSVKPSTAGDLLVVKLEALNGLTLQRGEVYTGDIALDGTPLVAIDALVT
jgi:hypothetical protein